MAGLDTNVLVRWLMDDDVDQSAIVNKLFNQAIINKQALLICTTVALELEWVLRTRYQVKKQQIVSTFHVLLEAEQLTFENEKLLELTLFSFEQGSADFADCLHAQACSLMDHSPLLTFDRKAAKLSDFQLLNSAYQYPHA